MSEHSYGLRKTVIDRMLENRICVWCGEIIEKGDKAHFYEHLLYVDEKLWKINPSYYHDECQNAVEAYPYVLDKLPDKWKFIRGHTQKNEDIERKMRGKGEIEGE